MKSINKTYDNILKTASDEKDNYIAGCLLHYFYFKKYYSMIAWQQAIDVDSKEIKSISFTKYLDQGRAENTTMFFITEKQKKSF